MRSETRCVFVLSYSRLLIVFSKTFGECVSQNRFTKYFSVDRNGYTDGGGVGERGGGIPDTHFLVSEPQEGRTYLS